MKLWQAIPLIGMTLGLALGCAHGRHGRRPQGPVARVDNRFEFTVKGSFPKVAPMFGAWAERAWAGQDWDPQFLFPNPPQDQDGMVFTVDHGHHESIWVNTAYDPEQGRFQYVYVIPGMQAVVIDVNLARKGDQETSASVRYRRTALDPRHNDRIQALGRSDANNGPKWAAEIQAGLKGR